MSYTVLRPKHFTSNPDIDNFDTGCLTPDGFFLLHRHSEVYYTEDEDCKNVNDMERIK